MIVVTGGAGFIGSNVIVELNRRGRDDILVVDDLTDGRKALNLSDCTIADYLDRDECMRCLEAGAELAPQIDYVIHLGACSDTTEWNGRYMMETNYRFSRVLFEHCVARGIGLVYASSAAVYGAGTRFVEAPDCERPLNVYGYSKLAFDQFVRRRLPGLRSLVVGLRYFNVYGPREGHKGRMASVVLHFARQLRDCGELELFGASHGYAPGEQRRDFIHVDDAVAVTLWCANQLPAVSGIYNCGTGAAATFNAVAQQIIAFEGGGAVRYRDFPDDLRAAYQAFTQADLSRLRALGYTGGFRDVTRGVEEYLRWLGS
jgi:ADP-L-glycero-D-manno-heptose 6-epimerase